MLYGLSSIVDPGFAQSWTVTTAPTTNWRSVAISADGTKLVAGVENGTIYTSTNSGASWSPSGLPVAYWSSVTSSVDGSVLLAANYNPGTNGGLYISTDWGATWTNSLAFPGSWTSAASSADGTRLFAVGSPSVTSTNCGATWTAIPVNNYRFIASSADGMKLVATDGELISTSSNFGATWTTVPNMGDGGKGYVASSADGTKLVLAGSAGNGGISVSTNSGATWVMTPLNVGNAVVASSADGTRLVANLVYSAFKNNIYTSTNSGLTWSANYVPAPQNTQILVACSPDGTRLVAAAFRGAIYTAIWPPALSTQLAGTNLVVSWPWPSVGFVLQQNCDLTTTNWASLSGIPVVSNYQNQVTISLSSSSMFYRLAGPSF